MIIANLTAIPHGAGQVEVTDYYDPNLATVRVSLDPSISALENAEVYFKKARKARDGAVVAAARMGEINKELTMLHAASHKLDSLESEEHIATLRNFLVKCHALRPITAPSEEKREKEEYAGYQIRKHISEDGIEILVGGNSESNDYLTTKIARPDDIWLHARSVKGAHVIVRSGKKGLLVPQATLKLALLLAVQNSEVKHSSLVPVDYTLRKYVRKPKGAAPGFVTYTHEKTVDVRPGD